MEKTKQWYVAYTRPGQEQKVCELLRRKKVISFYPVNRMVKTSYGRERVSFTPLIERYVFVYSSESQTKEIENLSSIVGLVHWLSKPVVIDENDVRLMRQFCDRHSNIQLQKMKTVSLEPALISSYYPDHNTEGVSLHFPVLGYNMTAEQSRTRVKVITIDNYPAKPETSSNQYAETR